MKTKTSQSFPPEEMSMLQAIKHVHYQVYYSSRKIDETIISDILLHDICWVVDNENEEVHTLWCTGTFLISFSIFIVANKFNTIFL